MFKKISLELGGKNPNIVFADADLDQAIATSVRAAFSNQGQICLCGSRIFVQRSIYEHFVNQFVHLTRQLKIGDPLDESTEQGALNSRAHLDKVLTYIELAKSEGGKIVSGGEPPLPVNDRCANGFFLKPTVITGLNAMCRTNREEIFGPVVTITPFDDEAHAIEYANCVEYGLAASIWTRDVERVHRISGAIHAGTVWVNCWMLRDLRVPFGGTKQSGVGREGGEEALRFFTEAKNVCVALNTANS
jgi:aminomuconate-semialdehyde/2-hydroxymuconate-6-semialdehyde dehydrogenase